MENSRLMYRPYVTYYYLACILFAAACAFCIGLGYSLSNPCWELLIPALFVISCLIFAIYALKISVITVFLEPDGLLITEKKKKPILFYPWTELQHMAQARSLRGHEYIILSQEKLLESQLTQYVKQSVNSNSPVIEGKVVLFLDPLQDTRKLKCYLAHRTNRENSM